MLSGRVRNIFERVTVLAPAAGFRGSIRRRHKLEILGGSVSNPGQLGGSKSSCTEYLVSARSKENGAVRGCCSDNADMVSFALGHNWIAFLGDVVFCGPPLSANVPRTGNKQKYARLGELFGCG